MHGRRDGNFHGGHGGGRGGGRGNKVPCHVCGKIGHKALCCYKHFDANYNSEEKQAHTATTGYSVDTDWYTNTSATDHITLELDKLMTREKYHGSDQVHVVNGSGMPISHIGHSTIHSRDRDLVLKDILHVQDASKNLVSVHKFTYNNDAFFEFHPWHFSLKDRDMKRLLLRGRCKDDFYPLPLAGWLSRVTSK
jgi:hypothetical protein